MSIAYLRQNWAFGLNNLLANVKYKYESELGLGFLDNHRRRACCVYTLIQSPPYRLLISKGFGRAMNSYTEFHLIRRIEFATSINSLQANQISLQFFL